MEYKTKFSVGQDVVLFNGVSMQMEHDEIFAVMVAPMPVEGKEVDPRKNISESLKDGDLELCLKRLPAA